MTPDRRHFLTLAAGAALLPAACNAAQEESWEVKHQRQLATDWPWLERYAADNAALAASGARTDIVFMGDSITEGWRGSRPDFFRPGRIGRGISGQTTPQMVLRMMPTSSPIARATSISWPGPTTLPAIPDRSVPRRRTTISR